MLLRYFISIILLVLAYSNLSAQTEFVNDPKNFVFYEVVEADSTPSVLLYHNASQWLRLNKAKIALADSLAGHLNADNEITIYKETGVLKKLSGKVTYKIEIEVKENKYRYHFHDFVFHYYGPDRFHKIGPTGKKKRLDESEAAGWQKLWDQHRADTRNQIDGDIRMLKIKIIERPAVKHTVETKKEVKWN